MIVSHPEEVGDTTNIPPVHILTLKHSGDIFMIVSHPEEVGVKTYISPSAFLV